MTDEEYVRSVWEVVFLHEQNGSYSVIYGSPTDLHGGNMASTREATMWEIAANMSRKRLEQIRQVEEEIENTRSVTEGLQENGEYYRTRVFERILAREQDALAELKRGMKAGKQ